MKRTKGLTAALTAVTGLVACAGLIGCAGPEAEAKPETAVPDRFYSQQLDWKACGDPKLDEAGAQCADVTVPLNYAEPEGATLTVAISRIAATDPARKHGVMLSNPGGPGGAGLDFMVDVGKAMTPDVRASYDLIGMDPRGIGRSSRIQCHWPVGMGLRSAGVDAAAFAESAAAQADLAARCATEEAARLPYITTRNTARDMDVIRGIFGVDRISYYGTSYGTYLGAVYTQMFPDRSDRIVLDSAADPDNYGTVGMMQAMGPANEAALDLWADWVAARDGEYHFGTDRAQVRGAVQDLIRQAADKPIRLGEYEVDDHWLPLVLFVGLDSPQQYGMLAGQIRTLADAAAGKPVELDETLNATLGYALKARPEDNSPQMAVLCGDVAAPRDPAFYLRNVEAARATQPVFGPFSNNITPCAFWAPPAEPATQVRNSVPALIVQSTGDTRTAYDGAVALHRDMSASRLVTLKDVPIHWIFGRYENACAYSAVNTYFRDGTLPAEDVTCRAD
ncbi:TAP-like protein [Nocardia tenerifensis]|uniref:TAP-like protein n=1 Tax=Nocardia tenerifensis TaxID=228006 RepID=A0A318K2S6_9NOCA|nr:alpha/beta fold hydrolase [Nocardia tenerifensis]PXX63336.1 TAP-like protein [Nocardia tenerifensis]